jgi:hypothetical protein
MKVRRLTASMLSLLAALCLGCPDGNKDDKNKGTEKGGAAKEAEHHDHKPNAVHAGSHLALLEAHLDEKELDIVFETEDKTPKPVALTVASFTAQVKIGDGAFFEVKFEPADAKERPTDKAGTCSRFVGKVPSMKPTDKLHVAAKVQVEGKEVTLEWKDFDPKKAEHKHAH